MIINDCLFEGARYISPPNSAATPPSGWHDVSPYGNDMVDGAGALAPNWSQLPSGLWVQEFDGGDYQYNATLLDSPGNAFTVSLWGYSMGNVGALRHLAIKTNIGGQDRFWVTIDAGEALSFTIEGSNGGEQTLTSAATITQLTWFHAVATYSYGVTNKLYLNMVEAVGAVSNKFLSGSSADFIIGAGSTVPTVPFIGYIGLPKVENYALNPDQVATRFAAQHHWFDGA